MNCTVIPSSVPSDAGIAGAGVLLSFIITAAIALTLSASLIIQDVFGKSSSSSSSSSSSLSSTIRRKLLDSYSDQQLLTGIGLQSLGLAQVDQLVSYHFFLIWLLGLLATAVHNAALVALVHDVRRDWVLRWLRQFLMFVNVALSLTYGVLLLLDLRSNLPSTLPVGCLFAVDFSSSSSSNSSSSSSSSPSSSWPHKNPPNPFQYVATVAANLGNILVFVYCLWTLRSRRSSRNGFSVWTRRLHLAALALLAAVAIGVTARVLLLSQAFGKPSVELSDRGETRWSFGQLLSMLMLLLPLVSVIETARGEVKQASDEKYYYDANPFFGKRSRLLDN